MKKLSHLLQYAALRSVYYIFAILPLSFSYGLAKGLGSFVYHVIGFRKKIVLDNLHIAFGNEKNDAEIAELAHQAYQNIAMSFIELMVSAKLINSVLHMIEVKHIEVVHRLLKNGHGLIMVSAHLGNWELQGAAAAAIIKSPVTVAATKQSNPYINRFITQRRNELGMQVAGSKGARKLLLRALKNHEAIGLVADQNAGRDAVFVDFFGKLAATQPGPAQLALKYKAPIVVGAAVRTGPGKFKILHQEVEIDDDDTLESLTQRHVKILEGFIRQYPEQYFWLHRRWKRRPPHELKTEDLKN
jgi:KDO2-lipid IV(A) lauroyltransferase